jgi:putative membrane protein
VLRPIEAAAHLSQSGKCVMSDVTDPRIFFAAERTLLAWTRTSLSLIAFGFIVERFGLYLEMSGSQETHELQREFSFYIGAASILLASVLSFFSAIQFNRLVNQFQRDQILEQHNFYAGIITNGIIGVISIVLCAYLALDFL